MPALAVAALSAQSNFSIGVRDVAWPNTTGQGSSSLNSRVYYPATVAGSNAPILPRTGGWPVIVFLHGFATPGTSFGALGQNWAQQGYVVVLNNTATFDNLGQERDGRALFSAVVAAAAAGPFAANLDTARIGLAGHSMGGGNVANILADNPGYRAGLALAPVLPRNNNGARIAVPLAIVVGTGDTITPLSSNSQPYYDQLTAAADFALLYVWNGDCNHTNIAGLFLSGSTANEVFAEVSSVGVGALGHGMGVSATAMEAALGPFARSLPRLVSLQQRYGRAQLWAGSELRLATTSRWSVAAEPGLGGAAAAFALQPPSPTPIGELGLDPSGLFLALVGVLDANQRLDATTTVPADPAYLGLELQLQAVAATVTEPLWLGGLLTLQIGS